MRASNVDRTREIIRRLGEFDFDGVAEMLSPSFVQEYPYPPVPDAPTRIEGVEAFMAFCRPGMSAFAPYAFTIEALYETTDPRTVLAEYSSHTHLLQSGVPYGNAYVGIFEFDDAGLLVRWREYLNPLVIARALGG